MNTIIEFLDAYLTRTKRTSIDPVEANALLERQGLLKDSKDRPGKPLRDLLRAGKIPHAYQAGGKGAKWTIPLSKKEECNHSADLHFEQQKFIKVHSITAKRSETKIDTTELIEQLKSARLKYKPEEVKYLLIAEAPPDSLDRFFYYEDVSRHDYLFLGVIEALYPSLKERYLNSRRSKDIKGLILKKLKEDGFYLLDLSELPLRLLKGDLKSQLPHLLDNIRLVADSNTQIILIKANVFDQAFDFLNLKFENIIDQRITFPGQGGQIKFKEQFTEALKKACYPLSPIKR
ncbi:hypothetical protein [Pedobacter sp. JCM 36344]|uniref:hypothetical protein n=1 Tax=Pedobacter sp. JCM 36344 TaxID=3374280 RepID=UPI00397E3B9E